MAPATLESPIPQDVPPAQQRALLLYGPGEIYKLDEAYQVPQKLHATEVLVKTATIGLNPIDWKAPDFNFGIPSYPYISGRELAGEVSLVSNESRLQPGDRVLVISTDYRDIRKAAYQEYCIAAEYNVARLPKHLSFSSASTLGVGFVTAALALGVSMGVDFSGISDGPDLFDLVRKHEHQLPADQRKEALESLRPQERAQPGDWVVIWGGSATSANLTIQLARLAGLRIAVVVDQAKHGEWLSSSCSIRPDFLVDSHDPARAVGIIRSTIGKEARFGFDTCGKESVGYLLQALSKEDESAGLSPPSTPSDHVERQLRSHVIGLAGSPKTSPDDIVLHTLPVKLFHEVEVVGRALTTWLERLLDEEKVAPARIIGIENGLESVNRALDRMRQGEISGGKLIVAV